MRKRDRDRIVRQLVGLAEKISADVSGQLSGSVYYFDANSEGKGLSFGLAAADNAVWLGNQLRLLLEDYALRMDVERSRRRLRRRT